MKSARHSMSSAPRILCAMAIFVVVVGSQLMSSTAAKSDVSGHYEGAAKDAAGEVITVALDLTEKDGALSGIIHSSRGDFTITGGSHKADDVTLQFEANGTAGTITLRTREDSMVGTWSVGEDGGPVEVKRSPAQQSEPKGKS